MKSYVKIYGPPLLKALRVLEKIAIESPRVKIRSFYDTITPSPPLATYEAEMGAFFTGMGVTLPKEQTVLLISDSGRTLGDYDFYFEWGQDPSWRDIQDLIEKMDEALTPLGCKYTIVTK